MKAGMRAFVGLAGIALALANVAAAAPRRTLEHYALVASEGIRARDVPVGSGDLGVNAGRLIVTGGIAAPDSQLVAPNVRMTGPVVCAGVYGDAVHGASGTCPAVGGGGGVLFDDPADLCGVPPSLPACAAGVKRVTGGRLVPGVYGNLVVKEDVDLVGGRYVFCNLRAVGNGHLRVPARTE